MTREEHLDWCKRRAMEYVNRNDLENAVASMLSDLTKHDETKDHAGITLGMMLMAGGRLNTSREVREFVEGFR